MKRPNPLSPAMMSAAERRKELCSLLALGLVRLRQRNIVQISDANGESSLHNSADQSIHATATNKEIA
jgi:hypothetical protein